MRVLRQSRRVEGARRDEEYVEAIIRRINANGVTVVFIEQNVPRALAHRGYILASSRTVLEGRAASCARHRTSGGSSGEAEAHNA